MRPSLTLPWTEIHSADWSSSDESEDESSAPTDLAGATRRIRALKKKLQKSKNDLADYRAFVSERLQRTELGDALAEPASSSSGHLAPPLRDDDSHYFQSYGENGTYYGHARGRSCETDLLTVDIHSVMIQDKVRTATYAKFILESAELFRDAIVLDVGCGTGILSLFAAKAGAKRVFAVDASDIAEKARQIVKDNKLDDVIT